MAEINNNGIIRLHRGDFLEFPIFINVGDKMDFERYSIQSDDKIFVQISEIDQPFEQSIIRKILTVKDKNINGDVILKLLPQDTEYIAAGTYYFQVRLQTSNGMVHSIVPRLKLEVFE